MGRRSRDGPQAEAGVGDRLLLGAIAGIVGTIAMTAAMRRLARRLPPESQYPIPPRELVEESLPDEGPRMPGEAGRQSVTVAAHFGFGALAGALLASRSRAPGPGFGAAYGVLVWAVSYLGWLPAAGILTSATRHAAERNMMMIAVHLVWGAVTAAALGELRQARAELFGGGSPLRDAPEGDGRDAGEDEPGPGGAGKHTDFAAGFSGGSGAPGLNRPERFRLRLIGFRKASA